MKSTVIISDLKSIDKIEGYWTHEDYIKLLEEFDFPNAANSKPEELWEMLQMAISDFEPNEAAEILLNYKLGSRLTRGQIENISHEMQTDKLAEEYPDISFHYELFNINQLLYDAYNGKFPHTEAVTFTVNLNIKADHEVKVNKEIVLKSLAAGLNDHNLLHRLFEKQLKDEAKFKEAENIIWILENLGNHNYQVTTSEYWISRDEFIQAEFSSSILIHED
tara:strand:- start:342 stop:1004 length:663 start_codon:yes stop_codon:yes gene_type:complete